ncbi:DUF4169 family protein [Jannaschia rubra]|uniref:DUF4169 family protein n=1 Tax=Jannaschia rubra TaxID=282197 RepID=UPI0024917FAF|nr:DUF4169 family protein [Jannaschia rubra]
MSKVASLSRVRKDRAKAAKRAEADSNAARFGRTREEKERERQEAERKGRDLDGHRIE